MIDLPLVEEENEEQELDPRINFFNNIFGIISLLTLIGTVFIVHNLFRNYIETGYSFGTLEFFPIIFSSIILILNLLSLYNWYLLRQNTDTAIKKYMVLVAFSILHGFILIFAFGLGLIILVLNFYILSNFVNENSLADDPLFSGI